MNTYKQICKKQLSVTFVILIFTSINICFGLDTRADNIKKNMKYYMFKNIIYTKYIKLLKENILKFAGSSI